MRAHDFYPFLRCSAAAVLVLAGAAFVVPAGPAFALSEIGDGTQIQPSATSPVQRAPLPSSDDSEGEQMMPAPPASDDNSEGTGEEEQNSPSAVHPRADPDEPPAEVIYDLGRLPEPVRRMHGLILEACKSGELEKLRPLIGTGETQTQLTLGDFEGDPITFIRELAGDDQGQEILAILQEILEAGYVHLDAGTPEELYVWPYFFALPLDKLTPPQRVELFRIVTAGDYEDMKVFGTYIFYRVGITPEGRWQFFVAGE
jgi:hypothetical protein